MIFSLYITFSQWRAEHAEKDFPGPAFVFMTSVLFLLRELCLVLIELLLILLLLDLESLEELFLGSLSERQSPFRNAEDLNPVDAESIAFLLPPDLQEEERLEAFVVIPTFADSED